MKGHNKFPKAGDLVTFVSGQDIFWFSEWNHRTAKILNPISYIEYFVLYATKSERFRANVTNTWMVLMARKMI